MENLLQPFAAHCPCCALISVPDLTHSLQMRASSLSLLRCKLCDSELREKASEAHKDAFSSKNTGSGGGAKKGSKATAAAPKGKGGHKGASSGTQNAIIEAAKAAAALNKNTGSFICLTCGFACCSEHATSHFLDSGKKRSKKGGQRHTEHHCVFYAAKESEPAVSMFKCYCVACDLPVGNNTAPEDMDYQDCIDGYVVNNQGYCIDGEDYLTEACILLAQAVEDAEDEEENGGRGGRGKKKLKFGKNKLDPSANNSKTNKRDLRRAEKKERRANHHNGNHGERTHNPDIKEQGIVGLQNLGNTCFFNSTLQCFLALKSLHNTFGFMTDEEELPGPMSIALRRTFGLVEASPLGAVLAPRTLFSQVCGRNPMFSEMGQQDAEELFNCISNAVIDEYELKKKRRNHANSSHNDSNNENDDDNNNVSGIGKQHCFSSFGAELNIAITCHECKTVNQLQENLLDFSLSITGCHSVVDALRKFFLPLLMSGSDAYLCEKCCHEEYLLKKKAEEAERRRRDELTNRMMEEGLGAADEIVAVNQDEVQSSDSDDDNDDEDEEGDHEEEEEEDEQPQEQGIKEEESKSAKLEKKEKEAEKSNNNNEQQQVIIASSSSSSPPPSAAAVATPDTNSNINKSTNSQEKQQSQDDETTDETPPTSSSSTVPITRKGTKKYCDATSESTLNSVRDVIVIQLKRFSINWQQGCYVKDHSAVAFSSELDLSEFAPKLIQEEQEEQKVLALLMSAFPQHKPAALKYVLEAAGGNAETAMMLIQEGDIDLSVAKGEENIGGSSSSNDSKKGLKYRLIGVVEHIGSADGGHYVSFTKSSRTGQWFSQSDSWVKPCSESDALKAQAYMLYYERI